MERYNPKGVEDRLEEQEEDDFLNGSAAKPSNSQRPTKKDPKMP